MQIVVSKHDVTEDEGLAVQEAAALVGTGVVVMREAVGGQRVGQGHVSAWAFVCVCVFGVQISLKRPIWSCGCVLFPLFPFFFSFFLFFFFTLQH